MSDDNTQPQNPATTEQAESFVLKLQLGLVLPFAAKDHTAAHDQAVAMARDVETALRAFNPAPSVLHILQAEVMNDAAFEELKRQAKDQADNVRKLLATIAQAAQEHGVEVAIGGLPPGLEHLANEPASSVADASAGDALADPIEADADSILIPGSRTLN